MKPLLSRWVHGSTGKISPSDPKLAVSQALRVTLRKVCPRCLQLLSGHRYQIYAMTVATTERHDALLDFLQKARRHEWESLSRVRDFDPLKNSLKLYALQCPDENLSMLFVRDPFELFDGDSLESWEPLREPMSQSWLAFLDGNKWVSFS